jgi:hypothetical protein
MYCTFNQEQIEPERWRWAAFMGENSWKSPFGDPGIYRWDIRVPD